jgi:hypothetical protein
VKLATTGLNTGVQWLADATGATALDDVRARFGIWATAADMGNPMTTNHT